MKLISAILIVALGAGTALYDWAKHICSEVVNLLLAIAWGFHCGVLNHRDRDDEQ